MSRMGDTGSTSAALVCPEGKEKPAKRWAEHYCQPETTTQNPWPPADWDYPREKMRRRRARSAEEDEEVVPEERSNNEHPRATGIKRQSPGRLFDEQGRERLLFSDSESDLAEGGADCSAVPPQQAEELELQQFLVHLLEALSMQLKNF